MKVITEGHKYQLENLEEGFEEQTLQFIQKELVDVIPQIGELYTVNQGTTNEEVLKMMVNRLSFLYYKFPSDETFSAIGHITSALKQLEKRTADRIERGVEGRKVL